MDNKDYLELLRANPYVKEKDCGNGIHSFNFTKKAFYKNIWDEQTITARGLFVDVNTANVFARSYNKFFNIDERHETAARRLRDSLVYPVKVYQKENGFLGICTARNGEMHYFSKSTNSGDFAAMFRDIAEKELQSALSYGFAKYLETFNYSAVFEVISANDRHFVDYDGEDKLILLALVKNDYKFEQLSYPEMYTVAKVFKITPKSWAGLIKSAEDFDASIELLETTPNHIEGFVLEDSNGFMFKVKTNWYKFWKGVRNAGHKIYNDSWAWTMMDISTPRGIVTHEDLELCGEAMQYYAFARESGYSMPHIMDVRRCLEKYSRLDHPYLV